MMIIVTLSIKSHYKEKITYLTSENLLLQSRLQTISKSTKHNNKILPQNTVGFTKINKEILIRYNIKYIEHVQVGWE